MNLHAKQVIEDPPCILTASRDRSVKLRALPTPGNKAGKTSKPIKSSEKNGSRSIVGKPSGGEGGEGGGSSSVGWGGGGATNNDDNQSNCSTTTKPIHGTVVTTSQEEQSADGACSPSAGAADGDPRYRTQTRPRTDANVSATTNPNEEELELLPDGFIPGDDGSSGGGGGDGGSLSSFSATRSLSPPPPPLPPRSVIPPQHGHDMAILTLGRIADGFRRDTYAFDVDLKGRGEGRAAEARAVLQVGRDV